MFNYRLCDNLSDTERQHGESVIYCVDLIEERDVPKAAMASPSDHNAAPSGTTSLIKNSPTSPESAGKPPRLGSQPGVENKNESVVRNISTAPALPIAHAFGEQCRRAISVAMISSTTPIPAVNCRTVHMLYPQLKNGLCGIRGWIPFASYLV